MRKSNRNPAPRVASAVCLAWLAANSAVASTSGSDSLDAKPAAHADSGMLVAARSTTQSTSASTSKSSGQTYTPGPPPNQHVPATTPPAPPVSPPAAAPSSTSGPAQANYSDTPDTTPTSPTSSAPSSSNASGRSSAAGAAGRHPSVNFPATGETRFKPDQVVVMVPKTIPSSRLAAILRRHHLTEIDSSGVLLNGASFRVWRYTDHRSVAKVERELSREPGLKELQPNYVYTEADEVAAVSATGPAPGMYALDKLRVASGLDLVNAEPIKVAVVDTAIDEAHPDLVGVVSARFDAIGGGSPPHSMGHGTAMAGAIAARGQVRGVAPSVQILSARAFDTDGAGGALGSSATIIKAIDWAVRSGARVVNMSFAGPKDPGLHEMLAAAAKKGVVLIGAMGNAGPKSPPLYPGADENVIAITATDAEDKIFPMANVGPYVAAAAPGVDVLLPAPNASYSLETGTSVSAALASGVAALALERKPKATIADMRKWLVAGARKPAPGTDKATIGAGVIDATATVQAVGVDGLSKQ